MKGSCLCGSVTFVVTAEVASLYQCHCSLCQKQSGSTSNTSTIVQEKHFQWVSGEGNVTHWKKHSGFTAHFCKTCGCPVPNPLRGMPYFWIPMGLIDDDETRPKIVSHLNCRSKASWDAILPKTTSMHEEMPESLESFLAEIDPKDNKGID